MKSMERDRDRFEMVYLTLVLAGCILLDIFPFILFRLVVMPTMAIVLAWEVYQFELPLPITVLAVVVAVWLIAYSLYNEWQKAKHREREDAMVICSEPEEEVREH